MTSLRLIPRSPIAAVPALLLFFGWAVVSCGRAQPDAAVTGGQPVWTAPAPGYPEKGASIDDAVLDHGLPPPPGDAVAYEMREPLRNGTTVPVKSRWLWIPEGSRIELVRDEAGRIRLRMPLHSKLWKEFYMKVGDEVHLVERRILLKVADDNEHNGWLLNGGWLFYSSHHLPPEADGVRGFDNELEVPAAKAKDYAYKPDAWMPTQRKLANTLLTFVGADGKRYPYMFPGKTNCQVCHEGASGAYGNAEPRPVLSFGAHPENLTRKSLQAMVDRGWIKADEGVIEAILAQGDLPPEAQKIAAGPGRKVVAILRNNCISCHNAGPRAVGRTTGFVLEPGKAYTEEELLAAMDRPSTLMGPLGHPVLTPGQPDQSELVLRLRGVEGRRRMPPAEGGVPEPDTELTRLSETWVKSLAPTPEESEAAPPAQP